VEGVVQLPILETQNVATPCPEAGPRDVIGVVAANMGVVAAIWRRRGEPGGAPVAAPTILPAMPLYEYKCKKGHTFDVIQSFADDALTKCEVCGAKCERVLSAPAIHFKGSGFYNTDYGTRRRAKEKAEGGGSDKGPSSSDSASSDSGSSSDSSSSSSSEKSSSKPSEKKAAPAASKD
jgi:putative FmdB family regulatory protein